MGENGGWQNSIWIVHAEAPNANTQESGDKTLVFNSEHYVGDRRRAIVTTLKDS
jgi:hypothetical protein